MRVTCTGTRGIPADVHVDDAGHRWAVIGNTRYLLGDGYGICPVCHVGRPLLKSGFLPKHDRTVSYHDSIAQGFRPAPANYRPPERSWQDEAAAHTETQAFE